MKRHRTLLLSFREVMNVSKPLFWGSYFLTFLQGIFNAAPIWALQLFFDSVLNQDATKNWHQLVLSLALYMFFKVGYYIIKSITDYNYEYYDLVVAQKMIYTANKNAAELSPIMFEDVNTLEMIAKAYKGTGNIRIVVDTIMMTLLYYLPELLLIAFYLYNANPVLPLIIVFIIFIVVIVEKIQSKFFSEIEEQVVGFSRKIEKFSEYSCGLNHYRETKTLGLNSYFLQKIEELISKKQKIEWKYFCKSVKVSLIEKSASTLGHICILGLLFVCTIKGTISIGMFAALVTSLSGMFAMMEELVGHISGGISEALGKVRNFFTLQNFAKKANCKEAISEPIECITLQDVCFAYPNQTQDALRNISLTINKGEHFAIVGENGSGKSTLTKLISGLYAPTKGDIFVNKKNITTSTESLRNSTSAVFQNFPKYHMTVRENITISDPYAASDPKSVLDNIGFQLNIESGLSMDTLLSREFGGTDISGGLWQRLSIARGFYRNRDLIILDEPTSSIDPVEEQKMLALLQMICTEKTSIIVTHRLGSIKQADKIIVMKAGAIVGLGSHSELLACCEEYRNIWNSQAQLYC